MAQTRETRLTLSGLVTQPSKYLAEPGTLATATNVMCRQPGQLEARQAFGNFSNPGSAFPNQRTPRLISGLGDSQVLTFHAEDGTDDYNNALNEVWWNSLLVQTQVVFSGAETTAIRCQGAVARQRNRFFFDQKGLATAPYQEVMVRVLDAEGDASARRGGLIPPSLVEVSAGNAGSAILANKFVGYRAHFIREHSDGYVQIGPVSTQTVFQASGTAVQGSLTVRFAAGLATYWLQSGDKIKIYRTVNFDTALGVSDTHMLTATVVITPTDITNGYATVTDVTADEGLGEFLYTNSGQGTGVGTRGINASKWYPPGAIDMCVFRNVMWYASQYSPTRFSLRVPGDWGGHASGVAADRDTGIGTFTFTGNTNSNTTISAVSATDMVGLAIGQRLVAATSGFTPGAITITALGLNTVTMSVAASTTSPGEVFTVCDQLEINGTKYDVPSPGHFAHNMAAGSPTNPYLDQAWLFFDRAVEYSASSVIVTGSTGIAVDFVAPSMRSGRQFALRATNGARYSPALPILSVTATNFGSDDFRENYAFFSEIEEPESVPILNYRSIGHGRIVRLIAVEDGMLAFCTDGTYTVTGDGQNWDIREYDKALKLLHRNAVGVMEGAIWALTNRGLVVIQGFGAAQEVSTPFIGNLLRERERDLADLSKYLDDFVYRLGNIAAWGIMLACDVRNREIWIRYPLFTYVFNTETKAWTTVSNTTEPMTSLGYSPAIRSILCGRNRQDSGTPSQLRYVPTDSSAAGRMTGASFKLNPFTGGDLNTRKQWLEVVYDLEILTAGQSLEVTPFFGSTTYSAYSITTPSGEIEHVVKVPRAAAHDKKLEPGITFSGTSAGSSAAPWRISGVTVKYRQASPDTRRQ